MAEAVAGDTSGSPSLIGLARDGMTASMKFATEWIGSISASIAQDNRWVNNLIVVAHLDDRNKVNLAQALGIREVQAKVTPGGPAQAAGTGKD